MLKKLCLPIIIFFSFFHFTYAVDAKSQQSLSVVSAKIEHSKFGIYNMISCIGKIKNTSNMKWDNVFIEVQFFNAEHELIDVITENNYQIIIPAKDEVAFKISGEASKEKSQYSEHKIRVLSADPVVKCSKRKRGLTSILIPLLPIFLLIGFFVFAFKKSQGKGSPQSKIIENQEQHIKLIEEQNTLFKELIETLRQR